MPDPYVFIRVVTIALATVWTVAGLRRLWRFASVWTERLVPLGFPEAWIRRQLLIFTLRATLLDPINLTLVMLLVLSWTLRLLIG